MPAQSIKKTFTDGLEDDSNLIDKFQNVAVVDSAKIFTYTDVSLMLITFYLGDKCEHFQEENYSSERI